MKTEELTALGLTEEQATKVLALNGLSVEKHKKRAETLEQEKTDLEGRLKTAEDTLKSFEGIDPEKIQQELDGYKKKAEDAESNFKSQMKARDQRDWLKEQFDKYGVASPYARRQLEADCMSEDGLKWDEKGKSFFGFDDFMKSAKEKDNGLYLTKEEKEAAEKEAQKKKESPYFSGPLGNNGDGGDKKYVPPKIF